jgi:hypothetical protein
MSTVLIDSPVAGGLAAAGRPPIGVRALRVAATGWYCVAVAGQLLFAIYVVGFYGRTAMQGHPEAWNDVLTPGYVPGDTAGNLVLASHLLFAVAVTVGGLLQLLPRIRQRWPRFHRWNGRVFIVSALVAAIGGLVMVWTRKTGGDLSQHVGISGMAVLIVAFGVLAWRAALRRRFDAHRRWALRLFLVANGGWFFRVGLMLWLVANQRPAGFDPKSFTGPFLTFLSFADYLVPLAVLELYFHAQAQRSSRAQLAMAIGLGTSAVAMAGGVAAAAGLLWLPHL